MIKTGRVINKEEMSVKSIIAETLISKGVGHILPSSYLKKATTEARHNYSVALHKLEKLQSRRTPNMKLIRNYWCPIKLLVHSYLFNSE